MVEESTIPLLNAQQLGMANLARGALLMPELSQHLTRDLALNLMRQQARQVNKAQDSNHSSHVDEEGGGQQSGFMAHSGRRQHEQPAQDADDEPSTSQHSDNPLVGKLLNVKV